MNGKQKLTQFSHDTYQRTITKVNDRIYHFLAFGHSNAIAIIGDTSVIMVDALDSPSYSQDLLQELAKITDKPVRTIIYTHGHPDHRGGAGAFRDTVQEVIAFSPAHKPMQFFDALGDITMKRGVRQFGIGLTDEEAISQGIGIREGYAVGKKPYDFLPPTTLYTEDFAERTIDGVRLLLKRAPGEMDDEIFVWLPDDNVMCCADNYYACWPNLYAIRGTQYRDVAAWVDALDDILSYSPEALLPGHTKPLIGGALIQEQVGTYRDAIAWVLHETLQCMNEGLDADECAERVKLPEPYVSQPYLQEFYGTIEWTVRSIFSGYLGWFGGKPEDLHPVPHSEYNAVLGNLIGQDKLTEKIDALMQEGQWQMALQLADLLSNEDSAKAAKRECLLQRADQVCSANGRHYLIACAHELD